MKITHFKLSSPIPKNRQQVSYNILPLTKITFSGVFQENGYKERVPVLMIIEKIELFEYNFSCAIDYTNEVAFCDKKAQKSHNTFQGFSKNNIFYK